MMWILIDYISIDLNILSQVLPGGLDGFLRPQVPPVGLEMKGGEGNQPISIYDAQPESNDTKQMEKARKEETGETGCCRVWRDVYRWDPAALSINRVPWAVGKRFISRWAKQRHWPNDGIGKNWKEICIDVSILVRPQFERVLDFQNWKVTWFMVVC